MEQLEKFLELLREKGVECICNWQITQNSGSIESYSLKHEKSTFIGVIFQTFGNSRGFNYYIEGTHTDMRFAAKEIFEVLGI